jgi:hypothetical protein
MSLVPTLAISFVTVLVLVSLTDARAERLQFSGDRPRGPIVAVVGNAWQIFARGEIDVEAADRFKAFVRANHVPPRSSLYLNSPGGSLIGGINLGRAIRGAGIFTYIGAVGSRNCLAPDSCYWREQPGQCYSVCALAFLGGEYRFIVKGSAYGVHRFYFTSSKPSDADLAQVLSASVIQYIRDMEVDPSLFVEMTKASASDIILLSDMELRRLNVINDGKKKTTWTIESNSGTLYLKGERDTLHGVNKFMLVCVPDRRIMLHVIFDPEGNTVEEEDHSIFIDDKDIPIND